MKDKKDKKDTKGQSNVIDMTERIAAKAENSGFLGMKLRWDLERTKVAVSTSLLSIVLLVTVANNSAFKVAPEAQQIDLASHGEATQIMNPSRGIASVNTGSATVLEQEMVKKLAAKELGDAALGQKPSIMENFAFGVLEGKYIVRHADGKIRELEYSNSKPGEVPTLISDRQQFLLQHRDIMPIEFERVIRVGKSSEDSKTIENFELLNSASMPVAKVQVEMDASNHLLGLKVDRTALAR